MDGRHFGDVDKACCFCGIQRGNHTASFDTTIAESKNFFAIASIGGFVPGWTLVCPKDHILNLGRLYDTAEFLSFADRIARVLRRAYRDNVVVFEHGPRQSGSLTGCGTDHAHLHLVPFQQGLEEAVRRFDPSNTWIRGRARDVDELVGHREYLLMAESVQELNRNALIRPLDVPRSQYFRHAIGNALRLGEVANYRTHPFEELSAETAARLRLEVAREPLCASEEAA